MSEHRIEPRIPLIHHMRVTNRDSGESIGFLGNITMKGVLLFSEHSLQAQEGQTVPLCVLLPGPVMGATEICFDAKCVWCKDDSAHGLFAAGYQIAEITGENKELIAAAIVRFGSRGG